MRNPQTQGPQIDLMDLPNITVIVGHAGVGKTNCSLGLALAHAASGHKVTLADLDIVNPYFRSSDYAQELAERGVHMVAPVFAGSTLDTPSLTGELDALIRRIGSQAATDERLIIDVGGDDDGATALGRYAEPLSQAGACMLYAVSCFRTLTSTPEEAVEVLHGIEEHAHLKAVAMLNTSNMAGETTPEHVARGIDFAKRCALAAGLPLAATVVARAAVERIDTPDARDLLSHEGACLIDPAAHPQIAALLTDGDSPCAQLVMMPKFVATPWDEQG
ncbi:MAG: hypothetical protein J6D54_13415 [Olsenella sp.]|nr:hypothetical protein [Olsenella sp.]